MTSIWNVWYIFMKNIWKWYKKEGRKASNTVSQPHKNASIVISLPFKFFNPPFWIFVWPVLKRQHSYDTTDFPFSRPRTCPLCLHTCSQQTYALKLIRKKQAFSILTCCIYFCICILTTSSISYDKVRCETFIFSM